MLEVLRRVPPRWSIVVKVVPLVTVIYAAKLTIDLSGADFITLTSLFGSIIAANVFLLGFLLAGTLSDYKESERLPGELAANIESITDECRILLKGKEAQEAKDALAYLAEFTSAVRRWFYREERTRTILERTAGMNDFFLAFEPLTQPNFIVRIKQEQASIRKIIMRIDTIRDTSFVPAAYMMAELGTAVLVLGLLFVELGPLYEEVFYVVVPCFFMLYLIFLIRDLDNPFNYSTTDLEAADVSIKPILDLEEELRPYIAGDGPPSSDGQPAAALMSASPVAAPPPA